MAAFVDVAGLEEALATAAWRHEGERWYATIVLPSLRRGEGAIQYDVDCPALSGDAPSGSPEGVLWTRGVSCSVERAANTFAG